MNKIFHVFYIEVEASNLVSESYATVVSMAGWKSCSMRLVT